jgi:hypothetical protein
MANRDEIPYGASWHAPFVWTRDALMALAR